MSDFIRDEVAFDNESHGYRFVATYLKTADGKQSGDALIEVFRGEKAVRSFMFPAYKTWNIAAHAQDIAAGLDEESDDGLRVAGSDGLGGNAYRRESKCPTT